MIKIFSYIFKDKLKNNQDDFLNYIMSRLEETGFRIVYLNYHTKDEKPIVVINAVDNENIVWVGTQPINNYIIELGCINENGECLYQII